MNGVIKINDTRTDYLYRLTLKACIVNDDGAILVVKEHGRDWWGLPGGGMDHGETVKQCLARELKEEIDYDGDFSYEVIEVEDQSHHLEAADIMQMSIAFWVQPEAMAFAAGEDCDEIAFMKVDEFADDEYAQQKLQRLLAKVERIKSLRAIEN